MITDGQANNDRDLHYLIGHSGSVANLWQEYRTLRDKVEEIVTLKGDDLCWRDIYTELAALVGISAFDDSLRNGGEYKKVWVERNTDGKNTKSLDGPAE